MKEETKNEIIQKLTELMIKQSIEDKKNKKMLLISVVDAYKNLIKLLKEVDRYE